MSDMRLGELLLREGVITIDQLEGALELHRRFKQRVGSSLVELGYIDADTIARALSAQMKVPAVLQRHVASIDPAVIALLPARVASTYQAIPLGYTQARPPRLVVAFRDPRSTPIEEVAFAAGTRVDPAVAPELVIKWSLGKYYGIRHGKDYVELETPIMGVEMAPASSPPRASARVSAAPKTLSVPPRPMLDPPPKPLPTPAPPSPMPAIEPDDDAEQTAPGFTVSSPMAEAERTIESKFEASFESTRPFLGTSDAVDALKSAASRDDIGDTIVAWLRLTYGCGLVLIVKDGSALGWKGYSPEADPELIESIAMPLASPSMLMKPYEDKAPSRGAPPEEGMALQTRLWKLLRCKPPREVLVAPIVLGNRVVNLIYAHAEGGAPLAPTALDDIASVAAAAAEAYARIIRTKK